MGKATENAVRAVISGPKLTSESVDELQVPYGYIGLPLYLTLYAFKPFIINEFDNYFSAFKECGIRVIDGDSNVIMDDPLSEVTPKKIEKLINLFAKSPRDRFRPVTVYTQVEEYTKRDIMGAEFVMNKESGFYESTFSLALLLYIIADNVVEDKHVVSTRYPVEDHRNIVPSKIRVLTTEFQTHSRALDRARNDMDRADIAEDPAVRNKRIQDIVNELELVGDKTRWNVPLIPQGLDPEEVRWIDSARPCNLYLSGWGGD